jgi:hypothetical protein
MADRVIELHSMRTEFRCKSGQGLRRRFGGVSPSGARAA